MPGSFSMRFLIAAMLALAACDRPEPTPQSVGQPFVIDPAVAAVVNGETILANEVELEAASQGLLEVGDSLAITDPVFGQILEQLIDQKLLAQEAVNRGLDKDENARHRLEAARERILGNVLVENLVALEVDEDAIVEMYEAQADLQQMGEEVLIRHILVETRAEADKLARELRNGAEFAELAFTHSIDRETNAEGGLIAYVVPEEMNEPFTSVIKSTRTGQLSRPFQTELGWHVLKVDDRRVEAPRSLAETRPKIVQFLTLSEISRVLKQLRAEARIETITETDRRDAFEQARELADDDLLKPAEEVDADADAGDAVDEPQVDEDFSRRRGRHRGYTAMKTAPARSPLAPDRFPDLPEIRGLRATTASIGLYGTSRDDLLIVHFPEPVACAGVFTKSATRSADVDWCRSALRRSAGRASALVVNAGNSNAFTGEAGIAKNDATLAAVGDTSGATRETIYLAATGVIGEPLAPEKVADCVVVNWPNLKEKPDWQTLASAFMTTDTFAKGAGRTFKAGDATYAISAIAKGSGMLAPNMATMLAYVFTDAPLSPSLCQSLLSTHVTPTLNSITVDSDTSTSDTLMLFATGAAGGDMIETEDDPRFAPVSAAVYDTLLELAHLLVRDGEGATKFVTVNVSGASSDASARIIAASIANSPLVKTALAASDANWGRVVMAVGKSGETIDRDALTIRFGDVTVAEKGRRAEDYSEEAASAVVARDDIAISVDVGVGAGTSRVYTCDLTHGYVTINGAYRT